MTREDYVKIVNNKTPDDSDSMRIRSENSRILIEVLKLLDKSAPGYEPCQKLLARSYYHWLPDYFFTAPASSTGKYHPDFANRSNGLMLHSLAVARIAIQLFDILSAIDEDDYKPMKNLLVTSAWLHDMFKYGDPDKYAPGCFTTHEHPELAAEFLETPEVIAIAKSYGLTWTDMDCMANLIRTHMGPYTTSKYSNVVLEKPVAPMQHLLFQADYLASRKENDVVKDVM